MTLTVRSATVSGATTKGSALTHAEMDENWNHVANFTQSGSGASTRTVSAKLQEWVSVKDFGATGDGTTDDSTAFDNAVSTGRLVHVPAGTYRVNVLDLPSDTIIYGEGERSILKPFTTTAR